MKTTRSVHLHVPQIPESSVSRIYYTFSRPYLKNYQLYDNLNYFPSSIMTRSHKSIRQSFIARVRPFVVASVLSAFANLSSGWTIESPRRGRRVPQLSLLSKDTYLENDLVALKMKEPQTMSESPVNPRLCVVRPDGGVHPLCTHEDDVETDLFIDPRIVISDDDICDDDIVGTYGEGWYGQRPVPSLGGGPGYGAEADSVWSIDEDLVEKIREEGVDLPVLDVGIAHGEKARGGAF